MWAKTFPTNKQIAYIIVLLQEILKTLKELKEREETKI